MKVIYLASPYSHPEAKVREERFKAVCQKAAKYIEQGICVFAPIAHSHPIADHMDEEKRMCFDTWMRADLPLLRKCDELHVLCLEGWRTSRGVQKEIQYADAMGIPVRQVYP